LLYNAACEVAKLGAGVPPEIMLPDAIAACSAAVHGPYDVVGLDGRTMPTSINTLSLAPSGAGKGTSFAAFFKAFFAGGTELRHAKTGEATQDEPSDSLPLQEVSYRALMEKLNGANRSTTIQHEDGWSFLQSDLFSKYPDKLTQLNNGDMPLRHKVHKVDLIATGSRCLLSLRIQPEMFLPILKRTNCASYYQGLWPRSVVSCYTPCSKTFPMHLRPRSGSGLEALTARLNALLVEADEHWQAGHERRKPVGLDLEAQAFMRELQYRIKQWQAREYVDIHAAAARAWENTLRLAAVFHVVCSGGDAISLDMVERAWAIVEWSLTQHRRILAEVNQPKAKNVQAAPRRAARNKAPRPNQSAQTLRACIEEVCRHRNEQWIPISDIEALTDLPPLKLAKAWAWLKFKKEILLRGAGARAMVSINLYSSHGSL
jgi:hypothetical protein